MKRLSLLFALMLLTTIMWADKYPIDNYEEPRVGTTPSATEWNAITPGLHATWADRDVHYQLHRVPAVCETQEAEISAWRGERANITAVLFSRSNEGMLSVRFVDTYGKVLPWCKARFINYIITDDKKNCGEHDMNLRQWLVPDVICQDKPHAVPACETRPVWCSIEVPRNTPAGRQKAIMQVTNDKQEVVAQLALTINVNARSLPEVAQQKFHLDFWQQPYAVSRYYGVERWSEAHIAALRPYLEALGKAGQKVVSAIMFYEPWGDQSHDKFSPMVASTKKVNGTWSYDYSVFDRYVDLCAEYGIKEQINCYSMVPWDMTFRYYDERLRRNVDVKTTTDAAIYREIWSNFLEAFKKHLTQKGWFDKTCIAMDERSEPDMLNAYAIASEKGFKMALAGNHHPSLCNKLYDYSLAPAQVQAMTPEQLQYRKERGLPTTVYFCCADVEPNIYTSSLPVEAAYLPLHAAANNLDGMLHWSWINWDEHPLTDSRYRLFGSGDTYCYYPGNRSSVRFERTIEGIHQYEKIQILKNEYKDNPQMLKQLNALLAEFKEFAVAGTDCAAKVKRMEAFLNGSTTTLFSTMTGGINTPPYRIPGITCTKDGRLIASAARLVCGTDPGFGRVDCVVKTSDDNGSTWSNEIDVAQGDASLINSKATPMGAAYGDPAIVADRESNEVLMMMVAGCTVYGYATTNRQNPNIIAATRSNDGGNTWQAPTDQTEAIYSLFDKGKPLEAAFVGSGRVFQSRVVKVGKYYRVYAALTARPLGNRVIYSDDFGRTWKALGGANATPVPDGDEPKCEELPDGSVVISSRAANGRLFNIYTYSNTKTGSGQWDVPVKATMNELAVKPSNIPTNGEMLIVPAKRLADDAPVYVVLQSTPTIKGRNNVGIYYKEIAGIDDCADATALATQWDGFYPVSNTASAYSSIDLQADDRIAMFYEEHYTKWGDTPNPTSTNFPNGEGTHNYDGYECVYTSMALPTITGGKYAVCRDVNRSEFLKHFFNSLIDKSALTQKAKVKAKAKTAKLPAHPTPQQIDAIRKLLK